MGRKPAEPSRRTPSFFKIMFGDDFSQQLRIPPVVVNKHFNGVLHRQFILRSPERRVRRVNVKRVDNNSFFEKGWGLFVQDNSIEFGDLLVFQYIGKSEFDVTIFGKSGCEKEAAVATRKSSEVIHKDSAETSLSSMQDQLRSKEFETLQGNVKQSMRVEGVKLDTQNASCSIFPKATRQAKARALEAASKLVSKYPFFKIVMTQSYIHKGNLHIPSRILKNYMKVGQWSATLKVSNKSWPVKLISYEDYSGKLSAGCLKFVKDNTLQEGDVCFFELIKRNDIVLKATIFRSVG